MWQLVGEGQVSPDFLLADDRLALERACLMVDRLDGKLRTLRRSTDSGAWRTSVSVCKQCQAPAGKTDAIPQSQSPDLRGWHDQAVRLGVPMAHCPDGVRVGSHMGIS